MASLPKKQMMSSRNDKEHQTLVEREVEIINGRGLHAKAAGHFRRMATRFKAEIEVINGYKTANGKSILGLMALEAFPGTRLIIRAKGVDAREAVDALAALVAGRFGEKE